MKNSDQITVSIYRSDYKIAVAIAKKENLRDRKNHFSAREGIHFILKNSAELQLSAKGDRP